MAAGSVASGQLKRRSGAVKRRSVASLRLAAPMLALWGVALTLVTRRLAGALVQPLPPYLLLACAACVLVVGLGIRAWLTRSAPRGSAEAMQPLATLAVVLMAWSLSLRGSSVICLVALWGAALAPEIAVHARWFRALFDRLRRDARPANHDRPDESPPEAAVAPMATASLLAEQAVARDDAAADDEPCDDLPEPLEAEDVETSCEQAEQDEFDERILQQSTRLREADGSESVEGWCRVTLAAGQRQATSHLAFCPPLDHVPAVEVEQLDGPPARIKVGQTLPQGARLELKLLAALPERSEVVLRFRAT